MNITKRFKMSMATWERWGFGPQAIQDSTDALMLNPSVLYADLGMHFSPLQTMYYSGDTHALCSTHPSSSQQEISSHYCPSCFNIANTEDSRCPSCFECPVCGSALTTTTAADNYFLCCTHCPWDSLGVGLCGESSKDLASSLSKLLGAPSRSDRVGEASGPQSLAERAHELRSIQASTFSSLVAHFSSSQSLESTQLPDRRNGRDKASWQPSDADALVAAAVARPVPNPIHASPLYATQALREEASPVPAGATLEGGSANTTTGSGMESGSRHLEVSLAQRLANGDPALQHRPELSMMPRRRALLQRRERRGVLDVKAGRPGILVKPNINPLEGDTSSQYLSNKKGEWWKKMKSAVQYVPRVVLSGPPPSSSDLARGAAVLKLRVDNPRHFKVSVWLAVEGQGGRLPHSVEDREAAGASPLSPSPTCSSLSHQLGVRIDFCPLTISTPLACGRHGEQQAQSPVGEKEEPQGSLCDGAASSSQPSTIGWLTELKLSSLSRESLMGGGRASPGIALEAAEDFLIGDSIGSSVVAAAAVKTEDGPAPVQSGPPPQPSLNGIVDRVHKDRAWVQVPLETTTPSASGVASVAFSLVVLEVT